MALVVAIFEPLIHVLTALPAVKVFLVRQHIAVTIAFFLTSLASSALFDAMRDYPSIELRCVFADLLAQCGNDIIHLTRNGMLAGCYPHQWHARSCVPVLRLQSRNPQAYTVTSSTNLSLIPAPYQDLRNVSSA